VRRAIRPTLHDLPFDHATGVDLDGPALAEIAKDYGYTLAELRKLWIGHCSGSTAVPMGCSPSRASKWITSPGTQFTPPASRGSRP
jgi:hypothetical protein